MISFCPFNRSVNQKLHLGVEDFNIVHYEPI